jgi:hypothetical protein
VPGVGDTEDLGDGALAVDHQPVHLAEDVADLAEVVLGGQPGPGEQLDDCFRIGLRVSCRDK